MSIENDDEEENRQKKNIEKRSERKTKTPRKVK